jgi:hypothetical protein
MTDKLLNSEYVQNPSNRSGPCEAHVECHMPACCMLYRNVTFRKLVFCVQGGLESCKLSKSWDRLCSVLSHYTTYMRNWETDNSRSASKETLRICGTRTFITALTRAHHWYCDRWIQTTSYSSNVSQLLFNITLTPTMKSSKFSLPYTFSDLFFLLLLLFWLLPLGASFRFSFLI